MEIFGKEVLGKHPLGRLRYRRMTLSMCKYDMNAGRWVMITKVPP